MVAPGRSRGWAMAILIGILIVLVMAVAVPVAGSFAEQSDEIEQSKSLLAAYRAEIAARPALEARLAALGRREASTSGLLRGDSTALAAANMQGLVTALVHQHGGQVRSVQNFPSAPAGGLEKIVVQYDLSLPLASLQNVIYQLETGQPFLFLDHVDIRPEEGGTLDGPGAAPRDLHVEFLIRGYRWAGTP